MVSKKLSIYGFISAAAIVSGALVGCGGSSSSGSAPTPITTTGGISTNPGTSATAVTASATPQQVQVTTGAGVVTGTLPAGESIPVGGSVGVINNNAPIINGLGLGARVLGQKAAPASGTQGQVWVDGVDTGLTVTSGGSLSGILLLAPGTHTVHAQGPFVIVSGSTFAPKTLTVGQFNFGVVVLTDGTPSIPSDLTLALPVNHGLLTPSTTYHVDTQYPSAFTGYTGKLIISYGGTTVSKSQVLAADEVNGVSIASYSALSTHPRLLTNGVDNVTFNIAR
jgi:hypothetical protein